ncbi:class I SAM-dependent methyltransferase [Parasalinivibrio latis]|uniref:class I SAM-dependent methyltransferase n=1 Tax=Parasalinivibrio latis TaxID=2952610 RepID=UPI0030DE1228
MWLRSRESLVDNGHVYDPVAATACRQCRLSPDCLNGNIDQRQLLYTTLAAQCDTVVKKFLKRHPSGWVLNVGCGLDTRFFRLDNGRCRWLELDTSENLLWREKLFHRSERYQMRCGSVYELGWLQELPMRDGEPLIVVCELALLSCSMEQLTAFLRSVGRRFRQFESCFVVAGDLCESRPGKLMGCDCYAHGLKDPARLLNLIPWANSVSLYSPIDKPCMRWRIWQRMLNRISFLKYRVTLVVIHLTV